MTTLDERKTLIGLISEATMAGARQARACDMVGLSARTVQRWQGGEPLMPWTGARYDTMSHLTS